MLFIPIFDFSDVNNIAQTSDNNEVNEKLHKTGALLTSFYHMGIPSHDLMEEAMQAVESARDNTNESLFFTLDAIFEVIRYEHRLNKSVQA